MIRQGEIYLVNFAKKYNSEFGKVRPAVIVQHNFLNRALQDAKYPSVLVVPLSTQSIETEYKLVLEARGKLREKSTIVASWICTLDVKRIQIDQGVLATLTDEEMQILKEKICALM